VLGTREGEGHKANVTSICFHMDGKWLVSASEDGMLKIWDLAYVRFVMECPGHAHAAVPRTSSPHRTYNNGTPGMFNFYKASHASTQIGLSVNDVCVHPNQGELISCDQAGSIKQWDLSDNVCTHELVRFCSNRSCSYLMWTSQTPAGDIPIRSVTLAIDGSFLVAGNNKVCTLGNGTSSIRG
jgi:G protein beta subunit-like protein